jgi:hypothetical protein
MNVFREGWRGRTRTRSSLRHFGCRPRPHRFINTPPIVIPGDYVVALSFLRACEPACVYLM